MITVALEYSDTDIEKMILNGGKTSLLFLDEGTMCSLDYTKELALDLARQTACGMAYMVGEGHGHFDLKPENVLVANTGSTASPKWVAKVRVNHATCRLCVGVHAADNNPCVTWHRRWLTLG